MNVNFTGKMLVRATKEQFSQISDTLHDDAEQVTPNSYFFLPSTQIRPEEDLTYNDLTKENLARGLEKTDKIEQKFSITTREMGLSNGGEPIYYIATGVDADKLDLLENEEVKCERAFKAAEKNLNENHESRLCNALVDNYIKAQAALEQIREQFARILDHNMPHLQEASTVLEAIKLKLLDASTLMQAVRR